MARRSVTRTEGLLRMLQSRGIQRGFWGTSRGWLWVAVGAFGLRQVRKAVGSEPKLVYRGELKRGQSLRIDHLDEVYGTTKHP